MKAKKDNSSSLIIGVVIALMGAGWMWAAPRPSGALDLSSWWAFGMLIPIFYIVRSAMQARKEGGSIMGYIAGAVGIFAVMLIFFGVIDWGYFPPITTIAVGAGFIVDSLG